MLVCFSAVLAMAQKPMNTHYVYEVRNDQGNLIQSTAVTCTLKVVKNTNDTIFKETHSATTDNLGRITVTLGKGTKLGDTEYINVHWSKTDNYILYATVNMGNTILGSEVPLLVGTNADSTTVLNLFGTKLPLARVATSGSYSDLTNRPTSMSQFNNDAHFLTSDSAVIQTMKGEIQANQSSISTNAENISTNTTNIATNAANIATNTANIELLKLTNFDTIYNKSAQDAKLHLTENYGFKIYNWGNLPQDEAAVYILNKSGDGVTKTSALTAKDDEIPSMTAFLVGKDPTLGQAAVIGTVNQGENPITGALGYSRADGKKVAVMAYGPLAFGSGHFATDINNTNALSGDTSEYTLVTEATLSGSIQNLASVAKTGSYNDLTDQPTIPANVAELTDAGDYAKLAGNNNFSGENTFSGDVTFSDTVIVPSGFNFTTTTSESCNMAVNACDLLTVFDSIQRQFTALRAEIDGLRDSLQDLRGARAPELTDLNFERTESSLTATATFNDHGATITEYEFCISTSQEMTEPTCQTTTDANYTFSGLAAGTQYYVTVAATNLKGTTTSDALDVQTVHAKPVLGVPTATAVSNTQIEVTGELTDMGGTTPTTVTVKAYTSDNHSGDEPVASANTELSAIGNYTLNITGLTKNTQYYIDVIADNGDKQDTATASAFTMNITVKVRSDRETDTIRTGSNVDVTVIYTATVSGIDGPEADSYSWKVNNTDSTSTSNELTVHYTEAGAYTVVCAYNDATDTAVTVLVVMDTITFVPNGGFGEMDKQAVEHDVETNLSANQFTHEGWTFKGWSNDCDHIVTYEGSNRPLSYTDGDSITTEGNVKLYAVWATSCTGIKGSNETGENGKVFSVKDVCNNDYAVVEIGNQCWMKENLRTIKYNDGNDINTSEYNNENGLISYQLCVVKSEKAICPTGWHLPSIAEFDTLSNFIKNNTDLRCGNDGTSKALATPCSWNYRVYTPWQYSICDNLETNNKSGFSLKPSDNEDYAQAFLWTTTPQEGSYYFVAQFWSHMPSFGPTGFDNSSYYRLPVRCVRNESLSAVTKTDSTAHSLTVSAACALEGITEATVCAYTDAECNTGEVCATEVSSNASPITATINGLNANTSYYVKVTVTTAEGSVSKIGGPFLTAMEDTITFIANGGTGSMQKQIVERGKSTPISTNSYQHGGYWQFIGWNDACDGNGNSYTNEANITTNGNVTLHAQWHTWCSGSAATNESGNNRIDSVSDHEGNWYDVVQIGTQCWLKENMRAGSLNTNPDVNIVVANPVSCEVSGASYYGGDINNYKKYGYLYGPTAASGICPEGWHLPSSEEWISLLYDIVGVSEASDGCIGEGLGKLAGGCDWVPTDNNPTSPSDYSYNYRNNTGFSALPGGVEYSTTYGAAPYTLYEESYFWATGNYDVVAFSHTMGDAWFYNMINTWGGYIFLQYVRCLRDVPSE